MRSTMGPIILLIVGILLFCLAAWWDHRERELRKAIGDGLIVPASRRIEGGGNVHLIVPPGEKILASSCCEKCKHIQNFWIECLPLDTEPIRINEPVTIKGNVVYDMVEAAEAAK